MPNQDATPSKRVFAVGRRRSGIALVIVLSFLVLITVLIIAYFTSISTESSTAKTYSNGAATKFLADSAVNVVMGQIARGTQGQVASSGTNRLTWASQPGMIRTYTSDPANLLGNCYKLYSSPHMVIAGDSNTVMNEMTADVPVTWSSQPALYTDLNAPVIDASGNANFPIIDGNNIKKIGQVLTYKHGVGTIPDIEGFYVQPSYVPNYTVPSAAKPLSPTNTPVPMPVQWLYVLKDGTIISPDQAASASTTGSTAAFTQAAQAGNAPTAANPIVGRIAFWTDDETCKLNINTASEGTYWATPHTDTQTEMGSTTKTSGSALAGFAQSPPATGEYNRYPGHPATTCLSVALGAWLGLGPGQTAPNAYTTAASDSAYLSDLANYLTLLPRSGTGGSCAGTIAGWTYSTVTSTTSRLFATLDELQFNPARIANTYTNSSTGVTGTLTRANLEEAKFFLTASSRAPELTPFNTPKVSLWPQWSKLKDRQTNPLGTNTPMTLQARALLAFCSSFGTATSGSTPSGKNEYFFQWYNSNWLSAYSSTQDWTNVPRNRQLATYLCNLGNNAIPGYGAAFRTHTSDPKTNKYSDRSWSNIVVECLDYIRSSVARDDYGGINFSSDYNYVMPLMVADNTLPGVTGSTPLKGFGYYPIYPQIALGGALDVQSGNIVPFIALQLFEPARVFPSSILYLTLTFNNPGNLGVVNSDGSPAPASITVPNFYEFYHDNTGRPMTVYIADLSGCKFQTSVTATGTNVQMGGTLPATISCVDFSGTTFQSISLTYPVVNLPAPTVPLNMSNNDNGAPDHIFRPGWCIARGMECSGSGVTGGDYRLLGGTAIVSETSNFYLQSAGYTGTNMQAHSLYVWCGSDNQPIVLSGTYGPNTNTIVGSLVPWLKNTDYEDYTAPYTPMGMLSATNYLGRPGDWDTGPNINPDGPYINPVEQFDLQSNEAYLNWSDWHTFTGFTYASFAPNRRIASAVQFGSLPTGVCATPPQPWQTLLFCPNPASRTTPVGTTPDGTDHIGFANPPDHMLLDFFTMPTVQPYAISEPLSTAGKVNLNYQLAPFTNIERSTALRGVLKNTELSGICGYDVDDAISAGHPAKDSGTLYKGYPPGYATGDYLRYGGARYSNDTRYDINRDATISGIEEHYFTQGNIFRYPSEICDVFLVPAHLGWPGDSGAPYNPKAAPVPTKYDDMLAWWNPAMNGTGDPLSPMCMTGDNLREEPYDRLYPRLTTQSNTFTVHYRVQVLQKRAASDPAVWTEGRDMVASEYRGSSLIERYIDPSDPKLTSNWDNATINVDFTPPTTPSVDASADLSGLYKFRVVNTKKFAP